VVANFDKSHKKSIPKERNFVCVIEPDKVIVYKYKFNKARGMGGLSLELG